MTQISGSVQLEVSARHLAAAIGQELIVQGLSEAVADRVLDRLHLAARDATAAAGSASYEREEPDHPQGTGRPWHGVQTNLTDDEQP